MLGPVAVDVNQIFIGDAAQLPAQFGGDGGGIELGVIVHDRQDRLDVIGDQFRRHPVEFGRVLDDPAQAVGGGGRGGISEGRGVALDVMGGAKQFLVGVFGKAVPDDGRVRGRKPVGLDHHPVLEFAGQAGKRLFRARDGVVEILFGDAAQHLAQRIGLGDDVMVSEGLDVDARGLFFGHGAASLPRARRRYGLCRAGRAAAGPQPRRPRGAQGRYRHWWCCAGDPARNRSWS